ncbi:MAG TPA: hypothetical protein VK196_21020 [Magnetospirillum sp.]|nr:hypothetical protein [Magnetospirillum sp.]
MFFHPKGAERGERPSKVYVRADTVQSEDGRVWLEAADGRWFAGERHFKFGGVPERALSVVEARLSPQEWNAMRENARWLALELAELPRPTARMVKHYDNLFDDGGVRYLKTVQQVYGPAADELDKLVDTRDIPDADPSLIENLISRWGDAVAVYDVGQGNCNAVLGDNIPQLYFDFGGGVLDHSPTFPAALQNFCFTEHPAIILSHWDWDHWSSAYRDPRAFEHYWIAPRQEFGAIHAACASRIGRNLLFWPSTTTALGAGSIRIERCSSRGKNRNHTGLALTVSDGNHTILLPGDARYTAFPSGRPSAGAVLSVVAPHHGADMRSTHVPLTTGHAESRVAYSCGDPNRYDHPRWKAMELHADAGWSRMLRTDDRRSGRPAHIRLEFPGHSVRGPCSAPCGESGCQLSIEQV